MICYFMLVITSLPELGLQCNLLPINGAPGFTWNLWHFHRVVKKFSDLHGLYLKWWLMTFHTRVFLFSFWFWFFFPKALNNCCSMELCMYNLHLLFITQQDQKFYVALCCCCCRNIYISMGNILEALLRSREKMVVFLWEILFHQGKKILVSRLIFE